MHCQYFHLNNLSDFEKILPFEKSAYDDHVDEIPTVFPCILEFRDDSSAEGGHSFHIKIIEDMSSFVFQDGFLYKLDENINFIVKDGRVFTKCI